MEVSPQPLISLQFSRRRVFRNKRKMTKNMRPSNLPEKLMTINSLEGRIFLIRGRKMMLDADLTQLFGVTTSGSMNR
jgi:hypothetical protein